MVLTIDTCYKPNKNRLADYPDLFQGCWNRHRTGASITSIGLTTDAEASIEFRYSHFDLLKFQEIRIGAF